MNDRDPLILVLMVAALTVIALHIYLTVKRMVTARWEHRRLKRHVSRTEMGTYWFQLVSLGLLEAAIVALVFFWKA